MIDTGFPFMCRCCVFFARYCNNEIMIIGAVVGESVDPCCASQAISNDSNNDEASIM